MKLYALEEIVAENRSSPSFQGDASQSACSPAPDQPALYLVCKVYPGVPVGPRSRVCRRVAGEMQELPPQAMVRVMKAAGVARARKGKGTCNDLGAKDSHDRGYVCSGESGAGVVGESVLVPLHRVRGGEPPPVVLFQVVPHGGHSASDGDSEGIARGGLSVETSTSIQGFYGV